MKTLPKIGSKVVCLEESEPYRYFIHTVVGYREVHCPSFGYPDEVSEEIWPVIQGIQRMLGYTRMPSHQSNLTPLSQLSKAQRKYLQERTHEYLR